MQQDDETGCVPRHRAAGIALFQAGLAAGKPWGRAAWGGRHPGVLPMRLRIASAIAAAAVYPLLIWHVAASAEIVSAWALPGAGSAMMWVVSFHCVRTVQLD